MAERKAAAVELTPSRARRTELVEHRNEVMIVGRLATDAIGRVLPSGDEVVSWRLIVERPAGSTPSSDTVNCSARGARVRRQALGWEAGEVIEIYGALRRRFWRGPAGLQNRYEVEVSKATRHRDTGSVKRQRTPG